MNGGCHREVDRCHDLIAHLDHGNGHTRMVQVLRHLQADETGTYDNSTFHLLVRKVGLNPVGVIYIAEGKDTFGVDAFQRRLHGIGPGESKSLS